MSARKEEWRDIPGYSGAYQVSNLGQVRTFRVKGHATSRRVEPKPMRIIEHNSGTTVCLRGKNGVPTAKENANITTLVALAFLGGIPKGMKAIHRNGLVWDNRLCNIAINIERNPKLALEADAVTRGIYTDHRRIMEEHLGRTLEPWEDVHHINGIHSDNRIENLVVLPHREHMRLHWQLAKERGVI